MLTVLLRGRSFWLPGTGLSSLSLATWLGALSVPSCYIYKVRGLGEMTSCCLFLSAIPTNYMTLGKATHVYQFSYLKSGDNTIHLTYFPGRLSERNKVMGVKGKLTQHTRLSWCCRPPPPPYLSLITPNCVNLTFPNWRFCYKFLGFSSEQERREKSNGSRDVEGREARQCPTFTQDEATPGFHYLTAEQQFYWVHLHYTIVRGTIT